MRSRDPYSRARTSQVEVCIDRRGVLVQTTRADVQRRFARARDEGWAASDFAGFRLGTMPGAPWPADPPQSSARVAAVVADLMLFSRIEAAVTTAGASLRRVDSPRDLPDDEAFDLVLVDWSARQPEWANALRGSTASRVILFGPHTDLEAHAAAREAGLGPMWARSKLVAELPSLVVTDRT